MCNTTLMLDYATISEISKAFASDITSTTENNRREKNCVPSHHSKYAQQEYFFPTLAGPIIGRTPKLSAPRDSRNKKLVILSISAWRPNMHFFPKIKCWL
ncbi:hypothetical protein EE612_005400 [Oryza sativa]|nr:hypothetical protein EE612_005400 [Oryza sativa]